MALLLDESRREQMTDTIAIRSDEAGFALKEELKRYLTSQGYRVTDSGCDGLDPVDYPDVALVVANSVRRDDHDRAVLMCGTAIGMAITANKVPGVFAAVAHDPYSAAKSRTSNDAQILTLGARVIAPELARTLLRTRLDAEFIGGSSARKVDRIPAAERAGQSLSSTDEPQHRSIC
jgi:ribose 5-phosphate isomerase B